MKRYSRIPSALYALVWCALLLSTASAHAAEEDWQRLLPSTEIAKQVLRDSPAAAQAIAQRRALEARADALQAGSAEFNLRSTQQRRQTSDVTNRYNEHSLALERPLRAWGKSALDEEVAAQTRVVADIGQADAMHEASRTLLQRWFDHLRAQSDRQLAQTQLKLAEQLTQQTLARYRHGEVSQLDVSLTQADLLRTQALHEQAIAYLAQTQTVLQRHYPQLPLPQETLPAVALPQAQSLANQKDNYLEHNHELRWLRADSKRLSLWSERVSRDRWPDPTVGLFTANERDGADRIRGVSLAFPLSGSARSASAKVAAQEALAAHSRLQLAEAQWSANFDSQVALVIARLSSAQKLKSAAQAQSDAARKAAKAYALGEHTMAELIQIQRNAAEQNRDAMRETLDALSLWATLQLDLHLLWDMDE